ncbi:trace amine-associated receptor 7a-like [Eucyclogobius newberryi]|uniref:trace amine-associated receptor 7a-like n=1 Tax=Eucyclogobius newberryi TaxID=166745 RepID=UPI003B5A10C6
MNTNILGCPKVKVILPDAFPCSCLHRQLQTSTHRILLSLAFSDFLLGLVVLPVTSQTWGRCWTWGDLACTSYYILMASLQVASVGTVVLISVDRYIAVMDPMRYQMRMTTCKVNLGIGVVWVYALLFCFMTMNSIVNPVKPVHCLGQCTVTILVEVDIVLGLVAPLLIIFILYVRIFSVVVTKVQAARTNCTALRLDQSKVKQKLALKGARNLGCVVIVHIICFLPFFCLVYSVGDSVETTGRISQIVSLLLLSLNSAVNPLIYVLIYPLFRKAFRVIITLKILRPGSFSDSHFVF